MLESLESRLLLAGDLSFDPTVVIPAVPNIVGLAAADFNKDGKGDVAIANVKAWINIRLGNGDGTFQTETEVPVGSLAKGVVAGDFNGDTWPDLAVTDQFLNVVNVLLNNGAGGFAAPVSYAATASQPSKIITCDLNSDGKLDLLVTYELNTSASYYINKGDGTFNAKASVGADATFLTDAVAADFNGDGKTDVAVTGTEGFGIYLQTSPLTFAARTLYPVATYSYGNQMIAADFTGDGKPDLAAMTTGETRILRNNGNGTFALPAVYEGGHFENGLLAADFNGDNAIDFAYADKDFIGVRANNGNGTFGEIRRFATETSLRGLVAANLNSGQRPDLVVGTGGSTLNALINDLDLPGNHAPFVSDNSRFIAQHVPATFALSDFAPHFSDVDGNALAKIKITTLPVTGTFMFNGAPLAADAEILVADFNKLTYVPPALGLVYASFEWTGSDGVEYATWSATFKLFGIYNADGISVDLPGTPSRAADFNGDGLDDLLTYDASHLYLAKNLGNGQFAAPTTINVNSGVGGLYGVAILDINRDGKLDLAVSYSSTTFYSTILNNGDGTFAPRVNQDLSDKVLSIGAGDFNGDGWDDLVLGTQMQNFAVYYLEFRLNNGAGAIGTGGSRVEVLTESYEIKVGDFNGDNKLDVLTRGDDNYDVHLGTGNGSVQTDVAYFSSPGSHADAIAVADFNGDGKDDYAVLGTTSLRVTISGGATANLSPAGATFSTLHAFDVNHDGMPDIVASGKYAYLNNGNGTFAPSAKILTDIDYSALVMGRFNNDTWPDLFSGDTLYFNSLQNPTTPASLAFTPAALGIGYAGYAIKPIVVALKDANGMMPIGASNSVTLSVLSGPGTIGGTATVQAVDGKATFNNIFFNTPGTYVLTASSAGFASVNSLSFTVYSVFAGSVPFGTVPTNGIANITLSPLTVLIKDGFGNVITTDNSFVTLTLASSPAGGALAGTITVQAVNGVATFNDVRLTKAGTYKLRSNDGTLIKGVSGNIVIAANQVPVVTPTTPPAGNDDILLSYLLKDGESEGCSIAVEYSIDGVTWLPATAAGGDSTSGLSSSPAGISHTFIWDSRADLGDFLVSAAQLRVTPTDSTQNGTPAATSPFSVDNRLADLALILDPIAPALAAFVPGEKLKIPFQLKNTGERSASASAAAPIVVEFRLSSDGQFHAGDPLLYRYKLPANLLAGAIKSINAIFTIPITAPGSWAVAAMVLPPADLREASAINNAAQNPLEVEWHFGHLPGRTAPLPLKIVEDDGTIVTLTLGGPGSVQVQNNGGDFDITLSNTTAASTLTITTKKSPTPGDDGLFNLHSLIAGGPLKILNATTTNLVGALSINSAVTSITLNSVNGSNADFDIAGKLTTLTIKQSFVGANIHAASIGTANITGNLSSSKILLTQTLSATAKALTTLKAAKIINTEIRTPGNIGAITTNILDGSLIFAGVDGAVTTLPTLASDFIDADAANLPVIASLSVKGLTADPTGAAFINSRVAAGKVTTVSLPKRDSAIGDTDGVASPFGFASRIATKTYAGPISAGDFISSLDAVII